MAAPNYSPAGGIGTTVTTSDGIYRFTGGSNWEKIGSAGSGSSNSGGSRSSAPAAKQNGGWYWNSATGQSEQYWAPGQQPQNSNPQIQSSNMDSGDTTNYDEIYNPIFASLDQQKNNLQSSFNDQQSLINKTAEDQLNSLGKNKQLSLEAEAADQVKFQKTLDSALSQAVRSFNALQQQARSRFGGQSSSGQAVGELAQQEFFRNQGAIQSQAQDNQTQLQLQAKKTRLFYDDEQARIETQKQQALNDASNWLRSQLTQIDSQRAMAESDKAARRMDALQRARDYTAQIGAQIDAEKRALETWKQQQDYLAKNNYQSYQDTSFSLPDNAITAPASSALSSAYTPTQSYTPIRNPNSKKDDEWSFLYA